MEYHGQYLKQLLGDDGQFRSSYHVDLCLCIDKTGSAKPIMATIKANVMYLNNDIVAAMSL